uniref:Uncharacterized protein n=1 Tax=Chromera velia CCMP2878 TaxID=1169474 RepID=A0A0G4GEQ3_9ALVE|eukprot:Cvel_4593.t1-p1 / transcript=Cvel_4593.t1 / gene=Cvel_4593 / organism=Chromera_velia_CCMP2878 / gene_product=hypothetical protein / transcript_product=hypothetical protein / location=Cvel_scaffold202:5032-5514(-) / protein_length=161 / sequence_SO=supercontig / SO=protein_coding / is_pseudo=false
MEAGLAQLASVLDLLRANDSLRNNLNDLTPETLAALVESSQTAAAASCESSGVSPPSTCQAEKSVTTALDLFKWDDYSSEATSAAGLVNFKEGIRNACLINAPFQICASLSCCRIAAEAVVRSGVKQLDTAAGKGEGDVGEKDASKESRETKVARLAVSLP